MLSCHHSVIPVYIFFSFFSLLPDRDKHSHTPCRNFANFAQRIDNGSCECFQSHDMAACIPAIDCTVSNKWLLLSCSAETACFQQTLYHEIFKSGLAGSGKPCVILRNVDPCTAMVWQITIHRLTHQCACIATVLASNGASFTVGTVLTIRILGLFSFQMIVNDFGSHFVWHQDMKWLMRYHKITVWHFHSQNQY